MRRFVVIGLTRFRHFGSACLCAVAGGDDADVDFTVMLVERMLGR